MSDLQSSSRVYNTIEINIYVAWTLQAIWSALLSDPNVCASVYEGFCRFERPSKFYYKLRCMVIDGAWKDFRDMV